MRQKELQKILGGHIAWLWNKENGERADLTGADLCDADLEDSCLCRADLSGARLHDAKLIGADLEGANLGGADLERADLREADLKGANLEEASLYGTKLEGTDLRNANLKGADLNYANLNGAELQGADLEGANLVNTCWPLSEGGLDVRVDKDIAAQLAYYFCRLDCDDPEYLRARNGLLNFANQFHRVDECGKLEKIDIAKAPGAGKQSGTKENQSSSL